MDFNDHIAEATETISSLWTPDFTREIAEVGIITEAGGYPAIVSSVDGEVLWRGGMLRGLPWAAAFLVAAKNLDEQRRAKTTSTEV